MKKKTRKKKVVEATPDIMLSGPERDRFSDFVRTKALVLADQVIEYGLRCETFKEKALALMAYSKYRKVDADDVTRILDTITRMPTPKIKALEGLLKKEGVIQDIKKGKASLSEIYNLPQMKKGKK